MRILIATQGPYGERIARNIRQSSPPEWSIHEISLPRALPALVDDPDEFLPAGIPAADLVISAGESPGAAQLIPDLVERTGARSVIAPIDNSAWLPPGLANQLKRELSAKGVTIVFPKPFCSLTETTYGYRRSAQSYEDPVLSDFARRFGRPKLRIAVNPATKKIEQVEVLRDSACGSVVHSARQLVGLSADEADTKAGLILHHYPCLCSMNQEQIDDRLFDTLMHVSGYIMNEEVGEQVKPFKTPASYQTTAEYVESSDESS
ncbi:MAG: hypothetical protein IBX68_02795 [Dehalococcoidia bacterium]|nr:hypothetical protein [Dehalococcoidia bacterium]